MTELPMSFVTNNYFYEINVYQDVFENWVVVCDDDIRTIRAGQRDVALPDKKCSLKRADVCCRHGYKIICPTHWGCLTLIFPHKNGH